MLISFMPGYTFGCLREGKTTSNGGAGRAQGAGGVGDAQEDCKQRKELNCDTITYPGRQSSREGGGGRGCRANETSGDPPTSRQLSMLRPPLVQLHGCGLRASVQQRPRPCEAEGNKAQVPAGRLDRTTPHQEAGPKTLVLSCMEGPFRWCGELSLRDHVQEFTWCCWWQKDE